MPSMTIRSGTRFGPYEIVAPIGAGGMGEVYRGRDTRLDRTVAIKILPAAFAQDAKFRIRFEREAKVISSLNHPHICALYDVGPDYLVMEHCEGETLAKRIEEGALSTKQVLEFGIQIADALDKAHRQGIIHRDLKPSNIMLTKAGVKLLDFGLAKQHQESTPEGSTIARVTEEGYILGTVQYMAPELFQGREADARSDIFALGLVLYEMVTGRPAFAGTSKASLIAAILEHEPEPLKATTPPALDSLIRACLEKDPDERIQTAHDVKLQLRSVSEVAIYKPGLRATRLRRRLAYLAVLVAIAGIIGYVGLRQFRRVEKGPPRATFTRLTDQAGIEAAPAISPDGKSVLYVSFASGNADIYLQRIGGHNALNLTPNSPSNDRSPVFSPDGQQIAFRSERDGGGILVMGATGESVRRVSDFGFNPSWSPDGKELAVSTQPIWGDPFVIAPIGELWRIEIATGRKRCIYRGAATPSSAEDAEQPTWSPHGNRIAFCRGRRGDILTIPSDGSQAVYVTHDQFVDWNPVWSADGKYLYFSSDRGGSMNLWRIAVDEVSGKPLGEPEPLTTPALWSGPLSISGDGKRVAYCARDRRSNLLRVSFDPTREIVTGHVIEVTHGNLFVAFPSVSPDGEWIAFSSQFQQQDLYVVRRDGNELHKLTDDPFVDEGPRWTPDGTRIAFGSKRSDNYQMPFQIWAIKPDGSGLQQLTDIGAGGVVWSPDGRRIAVKATKVCESGACFVDLTGPLPVKSVEPVPLFQKGFQVSFVQWSPDAKWLVGIAWRRDKVTDFRGVVYSPEKREYATLPEPLVGLWATWMSDSRRLLEIQDNKLYLFDRATWRVREIYSFGFDVSAITITKDDRTIYFLRTSDEADIWLAELK